MICTTVIRRHRPLILRANLRLSSSSTFRLYFCVNGPERAVIINKSLISGLLPCMHGVACIGAEMGCSAEPANQRRVERVREPRTERRDSVCESRSAVSGTTQRTVTHCWERPLTALRGLTNRVPPLRCAAL